MFSKDFKKRIFQIIPEQSFILVFLKKIYHLVFLLKLLVLQSILDVHIFLFTVRNAIFKNKPVRVTMENGTSFVMSCHGKESLYYWISPDEKEFEFTVMEKFLRPGMVFFDMGSCEGFFSLAVGASCKDAAVYSFEKEEEALDVLKDNVSINTSLKNIYIVPELSIDNFSNFLQKANIKKIDFLRANAGADTYCLFENMKEVLLSPNAPVIMYKISGKKTGKLGYHPVEILWLLQSFGYDFFVPDSVGNIISRPLREYEGLIVAVKENK